MLVLGGLLGVIPLPTLVTEVAAMTTETREPAVEAEPEASNDAPPAEVAAAEEELESEGPLDPEASATVAESPGRGIAAEDVDRFVMVGVTLPEQAEGEALVRVRNDGEWGDWMPLHANDDHGPDPGTSEADQAARTEAATAPGGADGGGTTTEPVWVGDADAYEVSVPDATTPVDVHLVREGEARVSVAPDAEPAGAAPRIHSRSEWGARAPKRTLTDTDDLKLGVVHHSVNTNGYSQAQVPALLRSIQAYHMDVQGWDDIGYNFLVDRFGRAWEARGGGIDKVVTGGHARGFNTGSTGVVVLGDFTSADPSTAAVTTVSDVLAWKFALHGVEPRGTVPYTTAGSTSHRPGTYTMPRIIGHRDVGSTSCPGSRLYARLGTIRSRALTRFNAEIAAQPDLLLSGDFNGDGRDDVLRYRRGTEADELWYGGPEFMTRYPTNINGTYRPVVGDFDGDGRDDIFWHGSGTLGDSIWYGRQWGFAGVTHRVGGSYLPFGGDFDGDGRDDIFWYAPGAPSDSIWFGQPGASFANVPKTVGGTFSPMTGDFDGDGTTDVFWYRPGPTAEVMWYGASVRGGFTSVRPTTIPETYTPLIGDFSADGRDDIIWYRPGTASDRLWLATGRLGSFTSRALTVDGTFWPVVVDAAGDGAADIAWYAPGATADRLWQFQAGGTYRSVGINVGGWYEPVPGDYSGEGRGDILWLQPSMARSYLWFGEANGLFRSIPAIR